MRRCSFATDKGKHPISLMRMDYWRMGLAVTSPAVRCTMPHISHCARRCRSI